MNKINFDLINVEFSWFDSDSDVDQIANRQNTNLKNYSGVADTNKYRDLFDTFPLLHSLHLINQQSFSSCPPVYIKFTQFFLGAVICTIILNWLGFSSLFLVLL